MTLRPSHRRTFSVTSSLQYRFLAMTLIYSFIIVSFFVMAVLVPDVIEMRDESLSQEIRSSAADRVLGKSAWIWPAVFVLIVVLGFHSFREFQKIMGPLYRFQRVFEQLEKGNLPSVVTTRKKDYLTREQEALNKMINSLAGKFTTIKQETEGALKSISELENTITKGSEWGTTQIIELLKANRNHIERLSAAIRFSQLQDEQQEPAAPEQDAREHENALLKEGKNGPSWLAKGL